MTTKDITIHNSVLYPGLREIAIKEINWESWLNLKVEHGLSNSNILSILILLNLYCGI